MIPLYEGNHLVVKFDQDSNEFEVDAEDATGFTDVAKTIEKLNALAYECSRAIVALERLSYISDKD